MADCISKKFRAMGTLNTIDIFGVVSGDLHIAGEKAARQAVIRVSELDDKWSVFKTFSEIFHLNSEAGKSAVSVSPDTFFILKKSLEYSKTTDGAFSVMMKPVTDLWRRSETAGAVPEPSAINEALALSGADELCLDDEYMTAELVHEGSGVDLGGIAKGYAAAEAEKILRTSGASEAVINFGGTVVIIGSEKSVGIQHPRRLTGVSFGKTRISDGCAVTSGDYERGYTFGADKSCKYHHIIDPNTGKPAESDVCSVTVTGTEPMEADALATAIVVLGSEKGSRLAARSGADIIIITKNMDVFCSEGIRERTKIYENI